MKVPSFGAVNVPQNRAANRFALIPGEGGTVRNRRVIHPHLLVVNQFATQVRSTGRNRESEQPEPSPQTSFFLIAERQRSRVQQRPAKVEHPMHQAHFAGPPIRVGPVRDSSNGRPDRPY